MTRVDPCPIPPSAATVEGVDPFVLIDVLARACDTSICGNPLHPLLACGCKPTGTMPHG